MLVLMSFVVDMNSHKAVAVSPGLFEVRAAFCNIALLAEQNGYQLAVPEEAEPEFFLGIEDQQNITPQSSEGGWSFVDRAESLVSEDEVVQFSGNPALLVPPSESGGGFDPSGQLALLDLPSSGSGGGSDPAGGGLVSAGGRKRWADEDSEDEEGAAGFVRMPLRISEAVAKARFVMYMYLGVLIV